MTLEQVLEFIIESTDVHELEKIFNAVEYRLETLNVWDVECELEDGNDFLYQLDEE